MENTADTDTHDAAWLMAVGTAADAATTGCVENRKIFLYHV